METLIYFGTANAYINQSPLFLSYKYYSQSLPRLYPPVNPLIFFFPPSVLHPPTYPWRQSLTPTNLPLGVTLLNQSLLDNSSALVVLVACEEYVAISKIYKLLVHLPA